MQQEIERKFLVKSDAWRGKGIGVPYRQGYLARTHERIVRVRIAGDQGTLTVKIKQSGITRTEYEYPIPLADAMNMLEALSPGEVIEKIRYTFDECGLTWEVDEFQGANAGLVVAEVELDSEDQPVQRPEWAGEEVSRISRYLNVELCNAPFTSWPDSEKLR